MEIHEILLFVISISVITFWFFHLLLYLISIFYGKLKLHKKCQPISEPYPGVTILKPLTGIDSNLFYNLETFFTLEYPKYEIFFCVADDTDPAISIVEVLLKKYPKISAKLLTKSKDIGVNPKINNIVHGYELATYSLILISDCGIKMRKDTLTDMVSMMTENVGLVHQMPYSCDRTGLGSHVEQIYFGTHHSKVYLNSDLFHFNCVVGMSVLYRKCILDECGGLTAFSKYIAEDYYFAASVFDKGWKSKISSHPCLQNAGSPSLSQFHSRMVRWSKIRSVLLPFTHMLEPISECLILGLLCSWALWNLFKFSPLLIFFLHLMIWLLLDYILLRIIQNGNLLFNFFYFVFAWLVRQFLGIIWFFMSCTDSIIIWRNRRFRIGWGCIGYEIR